LSISLSILRRNPATGKLQLRRPELTITIDARLFNPLPALVFSQRRLQIRACRARARSAAADPTVQLWFLQIRARPP
jgi:hypothetical protein